MAEAQPVLARSVVLCQPIYPRNIGSVARAMGNMGCERLILVDPQCTLDEETKKAAVGCQKIIQDRVVYNNWDEFYQNEGEGIRIAFTARAGKLRPPVEAEKLFAEISSDEFLEARHVYFIFGREDDGLSAEDIQYCHHTCTLETFGEYTSLNLSQAVLLALYTFGKKHHKLFLEYEKKENPREVLTKKYYPERTIRAWLETLGFSLSARRVHALNIFNRILLQNRPTAKELQVLESILQQNIRLLKEARESDTQ